MVGNVGHGPARSVVAHNGCVRGQRRFLLNLCRGFAASYELPGGVKYSRQAVWSCTSLAPMTGVSISFPCTIQ
jgi:hypothetical protein